MKAIWKKKLDLRFGGRYWILSIYFVIENSIKLPKNDFGRKNKSDNQFTLGTTTQPTLVEGLGFSWGHGNFGNNIRNMSQSIWDKIIKLTTTWNINWKHIGNTLGTPIWTLLGTCGGMKLINYFLNYFQHLLGLFAWGMSFPQCPKVPKPILLPWKCQNFRKFFSNWYDFMNFMV